MDKWLKDYKFLNNSSFKIFDSLPLKGGCQWGGSFDGWRLNFRAFDGYRLFSGNLVQEILLAKTVIMFWRPSWPFTYKIAK